VSQPFLNPIEELFFDSCNCMCRWHGHTPDKCTGLASGSVPIVNAGRTPVDLDACKPCRAAIESLQRLDAQLEDR
jgi:hypothetical protein